MEPISRSVYRHRVATIARHSDVSEIEIARLAVEFAQKATIEAGTPEALRARLRHVGYYLLDRTGSKEFLHHVGYRPALATLLPRLFRNYPDEL